MEVAVFSILNVKTKHVKISPSSTVHGHSVKVRLVVIARYCRKNNGKNAQRSAVILGRLMKRPHKR